MKNIYSRLWLKCILFMMIIIFISTSTIKAEDISVINSEITHSNNLNTVKAINIQEEINIPVIIRDYKADGFFFEPSAHFAWPNHNNSDPYNCQCYSLWVFHNFWADNTLDKQTGRPQFSHDGMINFLSENLWNEKVNPSENLTLNENIYNESTTEILEQAFKNINRYDKATGNEYDSTATLEDAKVWYETVKLKAYKDVRDEIDTPYRYVYYYLNNFFSDLSYDDYITDSNNVTSRVYGNNITFYQDLTLKLDANGFYNFDSRDNNGYFPINGQGFGNEITTHIDEDNYNATNDISDKNFHFAMEGKSNFILSEETKKEYTYTDNNTNYTVKGWFFNFTGDDDVWIYLNGKKVVDLSGIHNAENAWFIIAEDGSVITSQYMNTTGDRVGKPNNGITVYDSDYFNIELNESNEFKFFYMERHTLDSNLQIQTSIEFRALDFDKTAYIKDGENEKTLTDSDYVYEGDRVYYKFNLSNTTANTIKDIVLKDEKLNLEISKNGVVENGVNNADFKIDIKKLDANGDLIEHEDNDVFQQLQQLNPGEEIEIKGDISTVVQGNSSKLTNTATITWNYFEGSNIGTIDSSCTVNIGKRQIDLSIEKHVYEVLRNDKLIDISTPLVPGDVVKFKISLKNNSKVINNGIESGIYVNNIKLSDALYINNEEVKSQWQFTDVYGEEVDINNIMLNANETKEFYTSWIVSKDEANKFNISLDKDVKNVASIVHGNINKYAEVTMKLQPASLTIGKVLIDNEENINNELDKRGFTIIIKGNDGSKYVVEAIAGEQYVLDCLKYQEYIIEEIIPMNYMLQSITVHGEDICEDSNKQQGKIELDGTNNNIQVIVANKKYYENNFYHETSVENKFSINQ